MFEEKNRVTIVKANGKYNVCFCVANGKQYHCINAFYSKQHAIDFAEDFANIRGWIFEL